VEERKNAGAEKGATERTGPGAGEN